MITKQRVIKFVISVLALGVFSVDYVVCQDRRVVIKGKVVAFANSPLRLTKLTDVPREEILFVLVEKVLKGRVNSRHVKISYSYFDQNYDLPKDLFETNISWKFVLLRNEKCDEVINAESPQSNIVKINELEQMPTNKNIPCYSLEIRKLKPLLR